jgi:hypothetical protein
MGKFKTALINTAIGLWLTGAIYAQNPKINTMASETNKDLIETIDSIKIDEETETIISFMSNSDNKKMAEVCSKYWYESPTADSLDIEEKDSALYETITEMNKEYGNPKLTIKKPALLNGKKYWWHYSVKENIIYINNEYINNKGSMIIMRLAELSHSKQFQKEVMRWRMIKDATKFMTNGFSYGKLYNTEWTIEYDAHKIIEPKLYKEFLRKYLSKIDTSKSKDLSKAEYRVDYILRETIAQCNSWEIVEDIFNTKKLLFKNPTISNSEIEGEIAFGKNLKKTIEALNAKHHRKSKQIRK